MAKKIVYVVGGLYSLTGMAVILSQKINYLADKTDYDLYMILTESPEKPWYFKMNPRIKWVNFNINFDELDTMPLGKKMINYLIKQHKYKKLFKNYLMEIKPDITVSAIRRDINFINSIKDGSIKIGEIHFGKTFYRHFDFRFLPNYINSILTNIWTNSLVKNLQKLDKFVVLTKSDYDNWTELNNKIIIPNFINSYPEQQSSLHCKKVVAVGRYTWQKGFDLLIEAWAIVAKNCSDWNLHIYGPGDYEAYQKLANEKGLENSITCHSYAENVYDVYMNSSIFVLSSRYEGFGLVLAEAMAAGLPAVSFSCPEGPADIISDHIDGILVESENTSKLAEGLLYLINHEKERKEFGINARNNMKRYNKDNIMQEWIRLFESL
jgi:glycosyltransferase involved in cell wall biosynthesis